MKPINKYAKYFLIIFIIACGGVIVGKYISTKNIALKSANNLNAPQTNSLTDQINTSDYVAAPPTYGPIIQTKDINVEYGEDVATGYIVNQISEGIDTSDDVILFDEEGYVLPLGGRIQKIEDSTKNRKKITISLPEGTKTEFLSDTASIITLETKASKRVPITALQKDENGQSFVWMAQRKEGSEKLDTVRRFYIDVALTDIDYFEEDGHRIATFDPIIINPDEDIQSDKKYKIFYTEFVGSLHNPIKQAWLDYQEYKVKIQGEEYAAALEKCGQVKRNFEEGKYNNDMVSAGAGASSCGGFTNQTDPMAIFNFLINQSADSSSCSGSCGGGGSCGGASCGQ